MRLLCFASLVLFGALFVSSSANAAPEISPELIYGEWEGAGKTWKFYSTDLTRPEYQPTLLFRPELPSVAPPLKPGDPLYDIQEEGRRNVEGNLDPIGLRKAESEDAFTLSVGLRELGDSEVLNTLHFPMGRYIDNKVKIGMSTSMWIDISDVLFEYPMPGPTDAPDDMYKKVRTPVYCDDTPEPLGDDFEDIVKMQYPVIVTFPAEVSYHWIEFKFSVDKKSKEVQGEVEVWNIKRNCRYKYNSAVYNNENISTHEAYVSNRFKLKPVKPRIAEDYPDFTQGQADGAREKQAL